MATQLEGIRRKVFLDRYSLKDAKGDPIEQTPEEMWARVAKGIAGVEKTAADKKKWEKKFYDVMDDFKFLPGGRILAGAGTGYDVTYFNCFVIPNPPDSRGGIMQNLTDMIEIMAHGGGVGLNLSGLRPRGARVKKVNGFSSGPINWAELYSLATKDIVQQGGSRRGALMLMLHDWHPDIEEFITVKQDLTKINGANLSVCVSDDFMEAVKKDADWDLVYADLDDPKYDSKWNGDIQEWRSIGGKVKVYKTVKASYMWNLICEAAWGSAEPGLHFLDRSNKRSNTWYFEKLIATNPCGEQPLGAWAVCNLGAMNLSA
ncbi:MAG: ribonucleoside-diphosphate reductase alpha chain, partial [Patescibacteria group bacterium]|nr:ribonucleoside-diphosphate reductase alpha chain [Patescibacteria group bacterium]